MNFFLIFKLFAKLIKMKTGMLNLRIMKKDPKKGTLFYNDE